MSELPEGWVQADLGAILKARMGKTILSPELVEEGLPVFSASVGVAPWGFIKNRDVVFERGTIVVSARGTIGDIKLPDFDQFVSTQTTIAIAPSEGVEPAFTFYQLKCVDWPKFTATTAIPMLTISKLNQIHLCIAPLPEQRRIVKKVDGLSVRTARARKELDRIPTLIARYKQRLLALAFSGQLTAQWRAKNFEALPTCGQTLAGIENDKVQFSAKTMQAFEKKKQAGLKATKPRQLSQPEPLTAEQVSRLWSLPDKWQWLQIGTFCFVTKLAGFEYTDYVKYDPNGDLKVLKAENAGPNGFKVTAYSMIRSETVENLERSFLTGGELLIVFVGAGVGQVAIVPENERFFLGPNIGMARPYSKGVSSRYIELFLRSDEGKKLLLIASKSVAQPSISMGAIRATPVAIPPLAEQAEIVRRIASAFGWLDRMAADHAAAARLLPRLDAAILTKAFHGELVPQDPNDEPASVLLERMETEREATPKKSRGRKVQELLPDTADRIREVYPMTFELAESKTPRGSAMSKSRQDDDVINKPYLAGLLKSAPNGDVQTLFRAADLPVADFYKQLAWEIDNKHIIDSAEELKAA